MKILLLMPPTDLARSYGKLKSFSNPQPSIGIAYIAAVLREHGYDVKIVDAYVNQHTVEEILNIIGQFRPEIVGISVLTPSADVTFVISKNIRTSYPGTKIVMGNMHASLFADEILSNGHADFVVHREGEITMLELVKALENNGDMRNIKGISFRDNADIVNTPLRPHLEDIDILPYPAWDLFPLNKYSTDPRSEIKKKAVEVKILASRGCPNKCTFCSSRTERSLGSKYRMRDPKAVVDEMVYMYNTYGAQIFGFMDLAFPLVRKHAMDFCNEIISRGLGNTFTWITECRVKPLDRELLDRMRQSGCRRLYLGIESGNDQTLKDLKKNFTIEDVRKAVQMAYKAGIEVDGMFMIGLPGETEATIKETIDFAIELNVRYAIFNLFVPYPGCELYDTLRKENKIHFKSWSDFTSYPTYAGGMPVYVPDGLTREKLMCLQKYAMKKFYLRPGFALNELRHFKPHMIRHYMFGIKGLLSK